MLHDLETAVSACGFTLHGGFHPDARDEMPMLPDGRKAATIILIGSAGTDLWRHFQSDSPDKPDPLDRWTAQKLGPIAETFGAHAVFPFQSPFQPFQRWLQRAETCHVSPLRLLIHPEYGLWHAIRGAMLFANLLELPEVEKAHSPCKTCHAHPCMTACPVNAFSAHGLDTTLCAAHLASTEGGACMSRGCLARRACPVGVSYQHQPEQAAFHMAALLATHQGAKLQTDAPAA